MTIMKLVNAAQPHSRRSEGRRPERSREADASNTPKMGLKCNENVTKM